MRIVSLLPAATEIVWALGLGDDLVGISHACDFPPGVAGRPVVTRPAAALAGAASHRVAAAAAAGSGPPLVDVDDTLLAALRPDLVLAGSRAGAAAPDFGRPAAGCRRAGRLGRHPRALQPGGDLPRDRDRGRDDRRGGRGRGPRGDPAGAPRRRRGGRRGTSRRRPPRRRGSSPSTGSTRSTSAGLWVPEQVRRAGGWEVLAVDGEPSARTTWEAVGRRRPGDDPAPRPAGCTSPRRPAAWRTSPRPPAWDGDPGRPPGPGLRPRRGRRTSAGPGPRVIDGIELLAEIFDPAAFVDLAPAGSWVPVQ